MTPPDTSAPAVEAMIARLRDINNLGSRDVAKAADMLAAQAAEIERLTRERDAAREALAKAVEAEREACAGIVEGETTKENLWHWPKVSGSLWPKVARGHDFVRQCKVTAAAIRARKEPHHD